MPISARNKSHFSSVALLPTISSFDFALVIATLMRRQSCNKSPTTPLSFERTSERMMQALSRPWYLHSYACACMAGVYGATSTMNGMATVPRTTRILTRDSAKQLIQDMYADG